MIATFFNKTPGNQSNVSTTDHSWGLLQQELDTVTRASEFSEKQQSTSSEALLFTSRVLFVKGLCYHWVSRKKEIQMRGRPSLTIPKHPQSL